jgi:hypothetical protein
MSLSTRERQDNNRALQQLESIVAAIKRVTLSDKDNVLNNGEVTLIHTFALDLAYRIKLRREKHESW